MASRLATLISREGFYFSIPVMAHSSFTHQSIKIIQGKSQRATDIHFTGTMVPEPFGRQLVDRGWSWRVLRTGDNCIRLKRWVC